LVVSVQQALDNLGFDAGPPDGRVGTRTQFAIWQYEQSVGLPESINLPDNEQITPGLVASVQTTLAMTQRQVSALPQQGLKVTSAGSGFYLSNTALLLTNYHVVEGCKAISIHGQVASLVSFDPKDDLAVLHTPPRSGSVAALRVRPAVRAGERVVAVGFPLTGFLAAQANVTTGDVSSLAGIGNDSRYLQVTAPVQPGNSGGPPFDASGNVIGVVSAKLDAIKVAGITGDIPENVNFALKAVVVQAFLIFHFITYQTATSQTERSAPDIGDLGKSITELVECWQ
jgi:S1-C subfamily serine protease